MRVRGKYSLSTQKTEIVTAADATQTATGRPAKATQIATERPAETTQTATLGPAGTKQTAKVTRVCHAHPQVA